MSPVAQSGLDSVYESTGYAWPMLAADAILAHTVQDYLIQAASTMAVVFLIATRNYYIAPAAVACIFMVAGMACQPICISFVNGISLEEWSLGISGIFCIAVSLCVATINVANMALAISESPRTSYDGKFADSYLRTGPITTKSTLGNILIALLLFLPQVLQAKYGAFSFLRNFLYVLFSSSFLSWIASMVLLPGILAMLGLEVG